MSSLTSATTFAATSKNKRRWNDALFSARASAMSSKCLNHRQNLKKRRASERFLDRASKCLPSEVLADRTKTYARSFEVYWKTFKLFSLVCALERHLFKVFKVN